MELQFRAEMFSSVAVIRLVVHLEVRLQRSTAGGGGENQGRPASAIWKLHGTRDVSGEQLPQDHGSPLSVDGQRLTRLWDIFITRRKAGPKSYLVARVRSSGPNPRIYLICSF